METISEKASEYDVLRACGTDWILYQRQLSIHGLQSPDGNVSAPIRRGSRPIWSSCLDPVRHLSAADERDRRHLRMQHGSLTLDSQWRETLDRYTRTFSQMQCQRGGALHELERSKRRRQARSKRVTRV